MSAQAKVVAWATGAWVACGLCVGAGCAGLGGDDGGSDNLPGRGIAGWAELTGARIGEADGDGAGGPSALVEGGRLVVWFHRVKAEGTRIARVESVEPAAGFTGEAVVLEGGRDPSVVMRDGEHWMAWVDAEGRVRLSRGDGRAFAEVGVTGLPEAPRGAPSLVVEGDRLAMYMVADGRVVRAEESAPGVFGAEAEVFAPGEGCVDLEGATTPCWDGDAIVDAEVKVAVSPTGRRLWRMFYVGRRGSASGIGFAASDDGVTFSRYAFNPVWDGGGGAPAGAFFADTYLLMIEQRQAGTSVIPVLIGADAAPSEGF